MTEQCVRIENELDAEKKEGKRLREQLEKNKKANTSAEHIMCGGKQCREGYIKEDSLTKLRKEKTREENEKDKAKSELKTLQHTHNVLTGSIRKEGEAVEKDKDKMKNNLDNVTEKLIKVQHELVKANEKNAMASTGDH